MEKRSYGEDALFMFPLIDYGATDFVASVTRAAGDIKLFTDNQISANPTAEMVAFTSGSEEPTNGDTLVGATSTETCTFMFAVVTSGTWGGGDAAGWLFVKTVSGVFSAENLNISGGTANVLTIGGDFTAGLWGEIGLGYYCVALTAAEMSCASGFITIIDSATKEWEDQSIRFETETYSSLLSVSVNTMVLGTVNDANTTPTTTVFAASDITEATADHYNGRSIIFVTGALRGQATAIADYALDTGEGKFTVNTLTEAPADGDTFIIV